MPEPHEVFAAEQAKEWNQYELTAPYFVGGSRAGNVGDRVPASLVDSGVIPKDSVKRIATKTEAAAIVKDA